MELIISSVMSLGASREGAEEYFNFCSSRASSGEGTERHHLLMRSMHPEFKNEGWNIIRLSAADHIRAHIILAKIVGHPKVQNALICLLQRRDTSYLTDEEVLTAAQLRSNWNSSDRLKQIGQNVGRNHNGGKIGGRRVHELHPGLISRIAYRTMKRYPGLLQEAAKKGGQRLHEIHPELSSKLGHELHRRYPELAARRGKIGAHIRWHIKRMNWSPSCKHCFEVL